MDTLRLRIQPLSAFGTPPLGDTLFGQLCWTLHNRYGADELREALKGYTEGQPFAVISDALPKDHLPRPHLPLQRFDPLPGDDPKAAKKRHWLPLSALGEPSAQWLRHCRADSELLPGDDGNSPAWQQTHPQPHNSIDRRSGTTGEGFAPYSQPQNWYATGVELDIYLLHDPQRISADRLRQLFDDIGAFGFGRDASIGLGKFAIIEQQPLNLPAAQQADACLTLAPSAPQGLGLDPERSFYQPFTRFGRHGDLGVHRGNPFKTPLLLTRAGAVFVRDPLPTQPFIGQGLGGDGRISRSIEATVHQGYAPWLPIRLPH